MELPDSLLIAVVRENTGDGNVILIYCNDLKGEKKSKLLVIFSKSTCRTKYGCIYINSSNYEDIHSTQALRSQQIPALSSKYKFLSHDSFFDCSEIQEKEISDIDGILKQEPKRMIGKINGLDHGFICSALLNNPTLSNKRKKLYSLK